MGLDITLYRVTKDTDAQKFVLYPDDTNQSKLALFEKFKDFVVDATEHQTDIQKTFDLLGLDYKKYIFREVYADEVSFVDKDSGEELRIPCANLVEVEVPVKKLFVAQEAYQRKGMRKEFYTEIIAGCWYVDENSSLADDESMDFALTQEDLDRAKTYADEDAPIHQWMLDEETFVEFNY
jgi:hypothetical protein